MQPHSSLKALRALMHAFQSQATDTEIKFLYVLLNYKSDSPKGCDEGRINPPSCMEHHPCLQPPPALRLSWISPL